MREKKEIDRLFQERFKDFEAQPSQEVWAGIQNRLEKKKSEYVIPLWWKLAGVAAVLGLLVFVGDLYFSPFDKPIQNDTNVVKAPDETQELENGQVSPIDQNDSDTNDALVSGDADEDKNESNTEKNSSEPVINEEKRSNNEAVVHEENRIFGTNNDNKPAEEARKKEKTRLAENSSGDTDNVKETKEGNTAKALAMDEKTEKGSNPLNKQENQAALAENQSVSSQEQDDSKDKKSIFDELAQNDALNEDEDLAEEREQSKRWALTPVIAPVYYNSFSGSGIGPQFSGNEKEGGVNLSYGLLVSYAVNDKLTFRSGVNRIGLNYNTNNVAVTAGLQGSAIKSINYTSASKAVEVSESPLAAASNASNNFSDVLEVPQRRYSSGSLDQSLAYYEVPVEIEYTLVESKVGLQLIGGMSTLFLDDNQIDLKQGGFTTALGKSNSLNNVSFSTNIGVGVDYKFTDDIKFNLEPMFKYQLNAYKNSVSDFKPYYLGLYTGLSIRF